MTDRDSSPDRSLPLLDAGLRAGFGSPPQSTVHGGPAQPTLASGKYELLDEIGRGGIGVVRKGRDCDLGREVAIKVLHDHHRDDPAQRARFVAEARIGGRLQHPGIVPVYEAGIQDGLPFISMKLIEGDTLAALLRARPDASTDLRRFLAVFEQVGQAMAYAHSRGVVHRDLKCANVMIGAFGEVQVVDWGMAKSLSDGGSAQDPANAAQHSATEQRAAAPVGYASAPGTVMGTPAYMAPEQARGDLGQIDARTDVFCLGAMLCEILTAHPPYLGSREQTLDMAARADLSGARQRLAECRADQELIALTDACLAPDPAARPPTAAVVASRISAWLAGVEQRAQSARITAAEQRVAAAAARRAQRKTVAFTAAIAAMVLVAGATYLHFDGQRRAARAAVLREVEQTLAEAGRLQGQAEATPGGDLALWAAALSKAQAARALADLDGTEPEVRARAGAVVAAIGEAASGSRRRAEQRAKDRAMVERLEAIALPVDDDLTYPGHEQRDARRRDAAYAAAFADHGLAIDGDEAQAAATLLSSDIPRELALALDDWSMARRGLASDDQAWRRLLRLARSSDPDEWRNRLRDGLLAGGATVEALRGLAAAADGAGLPACSWLLLARRLGEHGRPAEAIALLRTAQLRHPDDFQIAVQLGVFGKLAEAVDWREVAQDFRIAVALRPRSAEALHQLGSALIEARELDAARRIFESPPSEALRGHWLFHLGTVQHQQGDDASAVATLRAAAELRPDGNTFLNLAVALRLTGKPREAVTAYERAVALAPRLGAKPQLAATLHETGEHEAAIRTLLEHLKDEPTDAVAWELLGDCSVAAGKHDLAIDAYSRGIAARPLRAELHQKLAYHLWARSQFEAAEIAVRQAIALSPGNARSRFVLGMVLASRKDLQGAAAAYREATERDLKHAKAWLNLGVVQGELGNREDALASWRRVVALDPRLAADAHFNIGRTLDDAKDLDGAEAEYRAAVAANDQKAEAWCNLGIVLRKKRLHTEGLAALERGHQLGSKAGWSQPSAGWVAGARQAAEKEAPALAVMRGEAQAADGRQALAAAVCASVRGRASRSAELYEQAFAADPSLLAEPRGESRSSAALMACAAASDARPAPTLDQRLVWLRRARAWMRAELDVLRARPANPQERKALVRKLEDWQRQVGFAALRDEAALLSLPDAERSDCEALWREIQELVDRSR